MHFIGCGGPATLARVCAWHKESKQSPATVSFPDGGPEGADRVNTDDNLRYCEAHGRAEPASGGSVHSGERFTGQSESYEVLSGESLVRHALPARRLQTNCRAASL
jgi:hypothetical protein